MSQSKSTVSNGSALECEMARRLRQTDWSATPLGPMDRWPMSLTIAIGICSRSKFPMFVWWGDDLINLYNDAYAPILGQRHPHAFGRPAKEAWAEIWDILGPQTEAVLKRGESTWNERVLLVMERNGYLEDTYFTWSYSPIPDGQGGVGGLFCVCTEDTGRVVAERERDLLASQRQLALDASKMGWWHLDPRTQTLHWDSRCAEIFEADAGNPHVEDILGRLHPDDVGHVRAAIAAALDPIDPKPYSAEYRIVRRDGSIRWAEAHGIAAFRGDGSTRGAVSLVGAVADITERRSAEERLRTSEERLALAVGAGELGTFYCPLPMSTIVWNDKCKEHFWLPADAEIDFDLFYARLHPDDRERTRKAVEVSIFERLPYDIEYRTVSDDGRIRWLRAKGRAYYDDAGTPTRFDGITLDISAQKELETALRESEERFREMADTAPAMLWITEADGYCSFLSRGWYEFTGQTPETGLGYGWANAAHPDDVATARDAFIAASAARMPCETDFRIRRADGEYRWVIDAGRPRFSPSGEFLGMIGSVIDITDRKRAEDERTALLESERAARAEADRASRMKDEFLATLSHELRTPLNSILGWSSIIRRSSASAADVAQGIEVIERNARSQAQIIEDLLEMSRIISGKVRLDVKRVELNQLVTEACETARPTAEAKGVVLTCTCEDKPLTVSGDPSRLQQVLWNLLTNAIKFTPRGGSVAADVTSLDSLVQVNVTDTGEGIRGDFLPFVFERFRQADASTTRRYGGLGLGLSIVKQLVELHGGTVEAFSGGVGEGSRFSFTLPLAGGEVVSENGRPASAKQVQDAPAEIEDGQIAGVRVLVVDDEPDARMLAQRLLEEYDAIVTTAGSSEEAIDMLSRANFDVIVSDIGMPGEDGHAMIRRVRELGPSAGGNVPAVALTAYARAEDRVKAIRAGFQMHVAKPIEPAELLAVIASLAKRTSPSAEN